MTTKIGPGIRWLFLLGAKFLQESFLGTTTSIILSSLSQLALIASMLLPLKIVMIMSSGQVQRIFPDFLSQYDEKTLIAAISTVAIVSFAFYNFANKAAEKLAVRAVKKIQARTEKLVLFEKQDELAKTSYLKVSVAFGSIIFIFLGMSVITWLYPELATAIAGLLFIFLLGYTVVYRLSSAFRTQLADKFAIHMSVMANVGFLGAFLFIVTDYMLASIPGFLSVLVSIVLARQIFAQASLTVLSIFFMYNQKDKLKAIFFKNHTFRPQTHQGKHSVWSFIENVEWKKALLNYLYSQNNVDNSAKYHFHWHETGLPNLLFLIAEPESSTAPKLLIKIYGRRRTAEAKHEASLLISAPADIPAPELLSTTQIYGYQVNLFDLTGFTKPGPKTTPYALAQDLYNQLLLVTVDQKTVSQYMRTHTMLWDKLDYTLTKKLKTITKSSEVSVVSQFERMLPSIKDRLKEIPIGITTKPIKSEICAISPSGKTVLLHWGKWSLDPMGTQYAKRSFDPPRSISLEKLPHLKEEDLYLASQIGEIVSLSANERYYSAYQTVERLITESDF